MRPEGNTSELLRRRLLAVQRLEEGYSAEEVAVFLGVATRSVWRWLAVYRRDGDEGLAAWPGIGPGRPPKLTRTQEKIVLRWLSESPIEYGFNSELWSTPRLCQLISQEFRIHFHSHYLSTWLRRRGYTPQKPQRIPRERNDLAINSWLIKDWPRIKRKAHRKNACLLLMDESGLLMTPLLRRSWALRGHPPDSMYKAGPHEKVSVAAALWISPSWDKLNLAYRTLANGYFANVEVAEFLDGAVQGFPGPVIVVWDGGTMHKGGPIRALVENSGGRLEIESLPAHAPTLMPVEYMWRWLKYGRLCNFTPKNAQDLNRAVVRELNSILDNQALLLSFFHQSRLPLSLTLFT